MTWRPGGASSDRFAGGSSSTSLSDSRTASELGGPIDLSVPNGSLSTLRTALSLTGLVGLPSARRGDAPGALALIACWRRGWDQWVRLGLAVGVNVRGHWAATRRGDGDAGTQGDHREGDHRQPSKPQRRPRARG
jgi:hypothetical protein